MKTKLQILSSILIIGLILNSNIIAQNYAGGGTEADPYQIYNQQDLYDLTIHSEDWGAYFIQVADINISVANIGIIGNSTTPFTGSYDGQGHTINAFQSSSGRYYVGLFGKIADATIKNLHLTNVVISGEKYLGGLVGLATGSSLIQDCSSTGSVTGVSGTGTSEEIGGLVGVSSSSSVNITNSYSECAVSFDGAYAIGGFIGRNGGSIINCYSTGSIVDSGSSSNYSYWGGFVGENNGAISNCFATGDVAGSGTSVSRAGGFVGYNNGGNIELCYATGNISNASEVGGFAGNNFSISSTTSIIVRSYSSGNVSSDANVGGFIGRLNDAELKNCYSIGDVTKTGSGGASYAGFCGDIDNGAIIEHCYSTGSVYYTPGSDPTDKGFVGTESSFNGSYNANFFGKNVSNQTTGTGATATDYLDDAQTFTSVSSPDTPWDIKGVQGAGSNDYWEMVTTINNGYPFIRAQYSTPTSSVISISDNSATCGGNVFNNGSKEVTERGVCWSTSQNPTIADSKTSDGTTTGAFTSNITGLSASTTYYVRAYVTNNVGTSYGDEETFTTDAATPVELTSFTATSTSSATVLLSWHTATEVNNYGFQVERQKEKGESEWENIGFVEGHGNSNSPKDYSFVDADKLIGTIKYRLKQIDIDGAFEYSDIVEVNINSDLPAKFELTQNYPNPFNPTTTINYTVPVVETRHALSLQLNVYDALGRKVATLVNETKTPGNYSVQFDASKLSSGIYYYTLQAGDFTATKKMILMK